MILILLTEQRGVSAALAGTWVSLFWASLTVGRIVFGFVVQRVAPTQTLRVSMGGVVLSTLLFWLNLTPWLSFASIALLGLSMAPQFPLLRSATPRYLGKPHAANGVGLQVAAAGLGGVLVTSLVGVLAQAFGLGVIAPTLLVAAVIMWCCLISWPVISPAGQREDDHTSAHIFVRSHSIADPRKETAQSLALNHIGMILPDLVLYAIRKLCRR